MSHTILNNSFGLKWYNSKSFELPFSWRHFGPTRRSRQLFKQFCINCCRMIGFLLISSGVSFVMDQSVVMVRNPRSM